LKKRFFSANNLACIVRGDGHTPSGTILVPKKFPLWKIWKMRPDRDPLRVGRDSDCPRNALIISLRPSGLAPANFVANFVSGPGNSAPPRRLLKSTVAVGFNGFSGHLALLSNDEQA